jgi:hypothetical protein
MMYFTTLIFTFLLSHVAHAMPACGDFASPQVIYDKYDNEQLVFDTYRATLDQTYDNPNGNTNGVACSNLSPKYPHFKDFPTFPYVGGAPNTTFNSPNCASCWQLVNPSTGWWIYFTAIDAAGSFNMGQNSFGALGGSVAAGAFDVEATRVDRSFCGT